MGVIRTDCPHAWIQVGWDDESGLPVMACLRCQAEIVDYPDSAEQREEKDTRERLRQIEQSMAKHDAGDAPLP